MVDMNRVLRFATRVEQWAPVDWPTGADRSEHHLGNPMNNEFQSGDVALLDIDETLDAQTGGVWVIDEPITPWGDVLEESPSAARRAAKDEDDEDKDEDEDDEDEDNPDDDTDEDEDDDFDDDDDDDEDEDDEDEDDEDDDFDDFDDDDDDEDDDDFDDDDD